MIRTIGKDAVITVATDASNSAGVKTDAIY